MTRKHEEYSVMTSNDTVNLGFHYDFSPDGTATETTYFIRISDKMVELNAEEWEEFRANVKNM